MSEKDELLCKVIKIYDKFKHNNIDNLYNKKQTLQIRLQEEKHKFDELLNMKDRLTREEERTNGIYSSLIEILKSHGIIFDIPNKSFKVREWDNLYIKDLNGLYSFVDKQGTILYVLDKKYNSTIKYIISNYSYSVIIIRKNHYLIKSQLRIVE